MKKKLIKIYVATFFFFITFRAFAAPGENNDLGDLETPDAPAPIDDYLLVFGGVAILLMFLKLKENNKQGISN